MIQAQSADGVMHEFPDTTDHSVIDRVMKQYAQNLKSQALPPPGGGEREPLQPPERDISGRKAGEDILGISPKPARNREDIFNERKAREHQVRSSGGDLRQDAQWQALTRELAQATTGRQQEATALGAAPVGAGIAGAVKAIPRVAKAIPGMVERLATRGAKEAPDLLQGTTLSEKPVPPAKTSEQLRERAVETAKKEGESHIISQRTIEPPEEVRQQVAAQADKRSASAATAQSYREGGFALPEAQRQVAIAERKLQDAERAGAQLEQEHLAKPDTTAEQAGAKFREATQALNAKYANIRANQSGYKEALASAGDAPRVPTAPAQAVIDANLKNLRNPTTQNILHGLQSLLTTGEIGPETTRLVRTETPRGPGITRPETVPGKPIKVERISIPAADSARKYLANIIRTKKYGEVAVDKEQVAIIKQVQKALVESATNAWVPYRQALAKWGQLSRPLEVIEKRAGLRKVIDRNPMDTDYAMSEAQVFKYFIAKAKTGENVFGQLLAENPDIKDTARLAFTHDLFHKEASPSIASMRTWLKTNERPLKQLGLYDEFRDLRVARETAQRAVDEATGQLSQAKKVETAAKRVDVYRQFEKELNAAEAKDVPQVARSMIKKMADDGRLTPAQYEQKLKEINGVEAHADRVNRIKKIVKAAAAVGTASAAGAALGSHYGAYHIGRRIFGD